MGRQIGRAIPTGAGSHAAKDEQVKQGFSRPGRACIDARLLPGREGTMSKTLVQEQFGATARSSLTSKPHARGKRLDRLVELTQPQPGWHVLDVATGAGHTAYPFAPPAGRGG